MTATDLAVLGQLLFGPAWVTALAQAISVRTEFMSRVKCGHEPVPADWESRILRVALERLDQVADAAAGILADRALSVARELLAGRGGKPDTIALSSSEGIPMLVVERVAERLRAAGWPAEVT
jgi:hypothetical protein